MGVSGRNFINDFGAPAHASLTYCDVKRRGYERIVNKADRGKILDMTSPTWIQFFCENGFNTNK